MQAGGNLRSNQCLSRGVKLVGSFQEGERRSESDQFSMLEKPDKTRYSGCPFLSTIYLVRQYVVRHL